MAIILNLHIYFAKELEVYNVYFWLSIYGLGTVLTNSYNPESVCKAHVLFDYYIAIFTLYMLSWFFFFPWRAYLKVDVKYNKFTLLLDF